MLSSLDRWKLVHTQRERERAKHSLPWFLCLQGPVRFKYSWLSGVIFKQHPFYTNQSTVICGLIHHRANSADTGSSGKLQGKRVLWCGGWWLYETLDFPVSVSTGSTSSVQSPTDAKTTLSPSPGFLPATTYSSPKCKPQIRTWSQVSPKVGASRVTAFPLFASREITTSGVKQADFFVFL